MFKNKSNSGKNNICGETVRLLFEKKKRIPDNFAGDVSLLLIFQS